MTTIATQGDFKVELIGSTYYLTDNTGQVWHREDTEKKIMNRFKKVLSSCYPS